MIEIGYNFLKKDLNKIQKFKNTTLDIDKNRICSLVVISSSAINKVLGN